MRSPPSESGQALVRHAESPVLLDAAEQALVVAPRQQPHPRGHQGSVQEDAPPPAVGVVGGGLGGTLLNFAGFVSYCDWLIRAVSRVPIKAQLL